MLKPNGYLNGNLILIAYVLLAYHTRERDETVKDVFDTLSDADKYVVYQMIGEALESGKDYIPIARIHPNLKHFSIKQLRVTLFLIDEAIKSVQ